MSNVHLALPGSERAQLRALVATIEDEIRSLAGHPNVEDYRAAADKLAATWAELEKLLALGQAAELRECPRCKHLGMREATRCGYCFLKLPPLPLSSAGTSDGGVEAAAPDHRAVPPHS